MIYLILAPLVGALIPLMNSVNTILAAAVGNAASSVVIHIAGLLAVSVALVFREGPERQAEKKALAGGAGRLPFYYYLAGIIGVGTVYACNLSYARLGASLVVALALFGQTVASVLMDATGLLGRRRYPLSLRNIPGLFLAALGILYMSWGSWQADIVFLALAFLSGVLPLLSFALNSRLAGRIGLMRGVRMNYIAGLATSIIILAAAGGLSPAAVSSQGRGAGAAAMVQGIGAARGLPFWVLCGGGILGVLMTAGTNWIFPKIPALVSTLLMFAGQTAAGLIIDLALTGHFDPRKLIGTLIVVAGLAVNSVLTARRAEGSRGA